MKIGQHNTLIIDRDTSVGMFLRDKEGQEVLLPNKYIPEEVEIGDEIEVFIYRDSEDRLIATTLAPRILVDDFACLKVVGVNKVGAFMDMGLEKDLLIPFSEQLGRPAVGDWYIVYMFLDEKTERLMGTMKWKNHCSTEIDLHKFQKVSLLIGHQSDLGVNVLVERKYCGLLYENQLFESLEVGDRKTGFVRKIRTDGKLDISLQEEGHGNVTSASDKLLNLLKENKGKLPIGDKSDPEEVKKWTQMSKKSFKKAVGALYKKRLVTMTSNEIKLVK